MKNMKIKIPFTKKTVQIRKTSGGSECNGNGYKHTTFEASIITKVGNGDDGSRCELKR